MGNDKQSRSSKTVREEGRTSKNTVGHFNGRGIWVEPEYNSGIPVEAPVGYGQPESLESMMARMIQRHMSDEAEAAGFESFEEADDLEEEDPDTIEFTHCEIDAMAPEEIQDYAISKGFPAPIGSELVTAEPTEAPGDAEAPQEKAEAPPESE